MSATKITELRTVPIEGNTIGLRVQEPPKYVGAYVIGPIRISLERRPSRWRRWWVKRLLGWVWVDL